MNTTQSNKGNREKLVPSLNTSCNVELSNIAVSCSYYIVIDTDKMSILSELGMLAAFSCNV